MAYEALDLTLANPAGTGAQVVPDLNRNIKALADAQMLGTSPIVGCTYQTFDADGTTTPATDAAIPAIEIISAPDGINKWKIVSTYDSGHDNRVVSASSYRSYDNGATWVLIETDAPTYDANGNIVG